jgi:hypothetical protein
MQKYSKFAPTVFDSPGLSLDDRQKWLVVPVIQTRDSGVLDRSNFRVALKMLGGEVEGIVEVHRFGHWGPGWFDIVIVNPDSDKVRIAENIECSLENYPVLCENDYSNEEWAACMDCWEHMSIKERVELCKRENVNIFSARSDYPVDRVYDRLSTWVNEG